MSRLASNPAPPPSIPQGVIELLPYQRADLESEDRFRWCCWSRQTGKSFTKSLRRLLRGLHRRRNQILLSAGERQSRELMLKVRQHCRALQIAERFHGEAPLAGTRFRQLTIELPSGVRIIGLPANPQTARGFTGDVLLDEFAMHREDREIWAAIFPSVLRGEGELDVASTPRGRGNLFAELAGNPRFGKSLVTLDDAVAQGLNVDVAALRTSMNDDELWRQEFCCEFLDDSHVFMPHELISRAEDPLLNKELDLSKLDTAAGDLFCGVDIGRVRDLTVIWLLQRTADRLVTVGLRESRDEPFREQFAAISEMLGTRALRRCCIDAGGIGMALAEAAVERFGTSRVEAVQFTAATKDQLASRLKIHVQDGRLSIPVDAAIRDDWHSVRRAISPAGPARYEAGHGPGGHADRFWAACLAVRAAESMPPAADGQVSMRAGALRYARTGIW